MSSETTDLSALRINKEHRDEPARRGLPWRIIVPVLLILLAAAAFLLRKNFSSPVAIEIGEATLISPSQASSVLTANGYVVAQVKASVASKATGRLEQLLVEEGDQVRRGEIIGRIESRDVAAALEQAQANLAVARADSFDARQSLERQQRLFGAGLTSRAELDGAEAKFNRVVATILSSEAAVRAAAVALENTRIRAPFDGTVLTKHADVGEVVAPFGASSNSKGAVVTMADMASLQVEADVSESNIMRVKGGQPCEIVLDAYPDQRYQGRVHKIVPTADRAKATVLTKVAFVERDDRVLPEMSAKVYFLTERPSDAGKSEAVLTLPSASVVARGASWAVFAVRDGELVETPVTIGRTVGSRTVILTGVTAGERVAAAPAANFSTGMKVTPK